MDPRPISQFSQTTHDTQFQNALYTPLPLNDSNGNVGLGLQPPQPQFASYNSSARDSYASGGGGLSGNNSALPLSAGGGGGGAYDFNDIDSSVGEKTSRFSRRTLLIIAAALASLAIIATAVAVPLVLVNRNNKSSSGGGSGGGSGDGDGDGDGPNTPQNAIMGGDGSEVTMEDGTTFTYVNKIGGYWVSDPDNPWNNDARPNEWTPPLNTSWDYSRDRIAGVNLGGLFVLEPFISPALFEKYSTASPLPIDEWTLSQAMAADTSPGGGLQSQLEEHYNTFITEREIAEIAGAGLNWIRLPVGFWAIETWPGEPFLEKVSWRYILRVFAWCRKYGIRIKLDLHAVPGSQNVWNHSGKQGQQNFLNGVMGLANAERTLSYIRVFTEFISQGEYRDVVPMFGIVNEPQAATTGHEPLAQFYYQAYTMMRDISGIGEGNGPFISFHEGFTGLGEWDDFLTGADRIALDYHPYFAFAGGAVTPVETFAASACDRFGSTNTSRTTFGVTVAGEWSVAINSCAYFLNGVGGSSEFVGDCAEWEDSSRWTQPTKDALRDMALGSMDALRDYFFWTWKIGNSTVRGYVAAPLWSYQLGLHEGYMPTNANDAVGFCVSSLGIVGPQAPATLSAWQTGGAGAGTILPAALGVTTVWPPTVIAGVGAVVSLLPTYTQTGPIPTLPPPSLTGRAARAAPTSVDGWFDDADTVGMYVTVAGCEYPMAWDAEGAAVPAAACTGPGSPGGTLTTTSEVETTETTTSTTSTTDLGLGVPPIPTATETLTTDTDTDTEIDTETLGLGGVGETVTTTDALGLPTTVTLARRGAGAWAEVTPEPAPVWRARW